MTEVAAEKAALLEISVLQWRRNFCTLHQSFTEVCGLQPLGPLAVLHSYSSERCGSAHAGAAALQSIQHLPKRDNKKVDAHIICEPV